MRRAQTEPVVAVRIEPSETWINLIVLIVENVGPGPAYNVRLSATPDFEMSRGRRLSELGLFRHGMRYLAPRQQIVLFLTRIVGQLEEIQRPGGRFRFDVRAQYTSVLGDSYDNVYPIDFLHLLGMSTIGTPPLQKIARDLEKIRETLGHIESGFRRLKVDIFTASDRDRESRDWDDYQETPGAVSDPADARRSDATEHDK
jgi:hypothetical protein